MQEPVDSEAVRALYEREMAARRSARAAARSDVQRIVPSFGTSRHRLARMEKFQGAQVAKKKVAKSRSRMAKQSKKRNRA